MKTKELAIRKYRKTMGSIPGIVYQFSHNGTWAVCSTDSPNAEDIRNDSTVAGCPVVWSEVR